MAIDKRTLLVLAAMVCGASATRAQSELRDPWTYDRLFKESDCVVIVAYDSSSDLGKQLANPVGHQKLHLVASKFKIEQSLKGELKNGGDLTITHWRLDKDVRRAFLPAPLVWEKRKDFTIEDTGYAVELSYLVFLRKARSGELELTTGILDGIDSVKELLRPTNPKNQ
jgi:hypothetical protein